MFEYANDFDNDRINYGPCYPARLGGERTQIVEEAGAAILKVYETDFEIETKKDESPLTQADLASHHVIVAGLQSLTPHIRLSQKNPHRPLCRALAVAPLLACGSLRWHQEFVNRNGEFTVNVALIDANEAVFGIVGVPVQQKPHVGDKPVILEGALMDVNGDNRRCLERAMTMQNLSFGWLQAATTAASDWRDTLPSWHPNLPNVSAVLLGFP